MNTPLRILLVHLFSNGDCLYATAVARQIKQDYPGCHLTWAIASFCRPVIDNNPHVDEVWEVPNVSKPDSLRIQRQVKKEALAKKATGLYDKVYFTQLIDDNIANYDGTIRSGIFRGYDRPITVPVTPVLRLRPEELKRAADFATEHQLADYKNVILFEFAPQSGQLAITPEVALSMAEQITAIPGTAIILSSAKKVNAPSPAIIDGSALTLRETAAITHYCTLLLGCSSGITWISTSDAAKQLPMIEMLDPDAYWVNPVSRDFERCGFATDTLIEFYENDPAKAVAIVKDALTNGFATARQKYFTPLPLQFISTRRSIYNMLVLFQFSAIARHIRINRQMFGWHPLLLRAILAGFLTMPFKLAANIFRKHILKKK